MNDWKKLAVATALAWCAVCAAEAAAAENPTPRVNIGTECTEGLKQQKISFVHVGDLHANYDPVNDKYSRIRAFYKKTKSENPYTIFTNAGDDHEKGSVAEQLSQGAASQEATFAMKFDVRTIGNHDFAWGEKHLLDFSHDPHSIVLLSNTRYRGKDPGGLGAVEYGELQAGCVRIGVLGLISAPWNELDKSDQISYFPTFRTDFNDAAVVRKIVQAHRGDVELMVMVSHLGLDVDLNVAAEVKGIDLVLGGHTHSEPGVRRVNKTIVLQPDHYGDGVTRLDLDFNLADKTIRSYRESRNLTVDLADIDQEVHQTIVDIATRYAPEANKVIAYLEKDTDSKGIAETAAKAGIHVHQADAALLDPKLVFHTTWPKGGLTQQSMLDAYRVERQKPNTPGANSQYLMEVDGDVLQQMKEQQPDWVYAGPIAPDGKTIYKVLVNKPAALNISLFFPRGAAYKSITFASETWWALDQYGRYRTKQRRYMDSDATPSQLK